MNEHAKLPPQPTSSMKQFEILVGEWTMVGTHPEFPSEAHGHSSFAGSIRRFQRKYGSALKMSMGLMVGWRLRACFGIERRSRQISFRELTLNRFHSVLMALYTSYNICSEGSLRPLTSRSGRPGKRRWYNSRSGTEAGQPTAGTVSARIERFRLPSKSLDCVRRHRGLRADDGEL